MAALDETGAAWIKPTGAEGVDLNESERLAGRVNRGVDGCGNAFWGMMAILLLVLCPLMSLLSMCS